MYLCTTGHLIIYSTNTELNGELVSPITLASVDEQRLIEKAIKREKSIRVMSIMDRAYASQL